MGKYIHDHSKMSANLMQLHTYMHTCSGILMLRCVSDGHWILTLGKVGGRVGRKVGA